MKKDPILENAQSRDNERLVHLRNKPSMAHALFIKFPSDIGAIRNMGRRGSNFAPEAIINVFKKLSSHTGETWSEIEMTDSELELEDFQFAQIKTTEKLTILYDGFQNVKKFIYLGGGHDHIYPTLKALNKFHKKITVLNIDAHLDTRIDDFHNSGTPFRQFANDFDGEFKLIQIGIHDFANTKSTMSDLGRAKEIVATYDDLRRLTQNFTQNRKVFERMIPFDRETLYIFSLDADALESGIMEGVSAVNHRGLPYDFVEELLNYAINNLKAKHFGIYEYNPLYDNLSQKGARSLASLIYQVIDS